MAAYTPPTDASKAPPAEANAKPSSAPPKGNPAFRMMGLPNFRFKLPSRNWLIFLSVTGSFTSLLLYDRYQKKLAQRKWCTLVSHLALEPLPTTSMPRKLTVYLAAPPGDSLSSAREYFTEYVKPILVSAALDWDVVEGRREGEVRAGLAERVRKLRRRRGKNTETDLGEDVEFLMEQTRLKAGVKEDEGVKGDIVIGRHTWKEYMRGLHEGWLGPIDPPPSPVSPASVDGSSSPESLPSPISESLPPSDVAQSQDDAHLSNDASPTESPAFEAPTQPTKPPKPLQQTPFISTSNYSSATLPPTLPPTFDPSTPLPFPHILGFFNTPIRIYRFLTRRHLANAVGRDTAAVVLAGSRPYEQSASTIAIAHAEPVTGSDEQVAGRKGTWYEQQRTLDHEEAEWLKSVWIRKDDEGERVWLDEIVVDPRVAARMRKFELDPAEGLRAVRIAEGKEGMLGETVKDAAAVVSKAE
ncbi:MAG: mitochondrial import inner membrane translocase subunit tim54 [Candelina submexicana]|nr:MAG: mitochondrial import inner membrane translocase subunit tim54 [Candelina submexicana]